MEGAGGGGGAVVLKSTANVDIKSVITELQTKWGESEKGFQGWVSKQCLPACRSKQKQPSIVETALVVATHALLGAAEGALCGSIANHFVPFQTRLSLPRSFAVLRGTNEGMICAMKRIRGKDDTKARAVAGFTAGFMFQVVGNMPSPPNVRAAIGFGLYFALGHGLLHEVLYPSQPPVPDDKCYTRAKCMLSNLGLQKYEKHFKKHLLTDKTMPLLKQSDLAEAGIPLGLRLLILDHIERNRDR